MTTGLIAAVMSIAIVLFEVLPITNNAVIVTTTVAQTPTHHYPLQQQQQQLQSAIPKGVSSPYDMAVLYGVKESDEHTVSALHLYVTHSRSSSRRNTKYADKDITEKTEVIYGSDNVFQSTLEKFSEIRNTVDSCIDAKAPKSLVSKDLPIYKILSDAQNRGVKLRYITEITVENISYCKELIKYSELRHLDAIKGNFGISDKSDFRASASIVEGEHPTELIVSTVKSFVKQQQYFFDMLWEKAIPAKQRIKEIEQGIKREFVETLREPREIQKLFLDLVKSAKEDIVLLFSTTNAFYRLEYPGLIFLLREAALQRSVNIRVLIVTDNTIQEIIKNKINSEIPREISFHFIDKPMQSKVTTLIVDMEYSLIIDIDDDTKQTFDEATGLSTYSNNESTVTAYATIFESLWAQSEFEATS